jgi:hypothetical protein
MKVVGKSANSITQFINSQFTNPRPNSILYNRGVLYFIFAIALFQLYTFSVSGNVTLIAIFILVGFLTSFFSKNMIVILVISLVFTGIAQLGTANSRFEGMIEGADMDHDESSDKKKADDKDASEKKTKDESSGSTKSEADSEKKKASIQTDGFELINMQKEILGGFEKIEPQMKRAEKLVDNINKTAGELKSLS